VTSWHDYGLQILELTDDYTGPAFESAALDENTGAMTITFDETIDVSETDLSKLYVSESGQTDEVSLTGAAFDSNAANSDTISLTLNSTQLDMIIPMDTPELDIAAGAVADPATNAIGDSPDNPIAVTEALAYDISVTTPEDTPVTVTIPDPHSNLPAITDVGMPAHGTHSSDDTSITYTPDQDYVGDDSFGYTVSYGEVVEQGTITVTVTSDNNAPELGAIIDRFVTVGDLLEIAPTVTDADPTDT